MSATVTPLDPDTAKGAEIAHELGELLARIAVDIHCRQQPGVPATRDRRSRSGAEDQQRRAAA